MFDVTEHCPPTGLPSNETHRHVFADLRDRLIGLDHYLEIEHLLVQWPQCWIRADLHLEQPIRAEAVHAQRHNAASLCGGRISPPACKDPSALAGHEVNSDRTFLIDRSARQRAAPASRPGGAVAEPPVRPIGANPVKLHARVADEVSLYLV